MNSGSVRTGDTRKEVAATAFRAAVGLLLALLVALPAGCGEPKKHAAAERPRVSGVEVVRTAASPRERTAEVTGTVRAANSAVVASQTTGVIASIPVAEGSRVEQGALLAAIEDAAARAQVAAAEGAVAEAEAGRAEAERAIAQAEAGKTLAVKTYERFRKLHEEKIVTTQEFEEVQAKKTVAEQDYERAQDRRAQVAARLAQAKAHADAAGTALSHTRITAPFAGVVTEKKTDAGSMATPGMPILVLEDTRRYRMEASVPESYLGLLRVGSRVTFVLDAYPGREVPGSVSEAVPLVDPMTRTFTVKVDLPGKAALRTGMSGRVRFVTGTESVVAVPRAAITRAGGVDGIFAIGEDNVARLVMVKTGEAYGDRVEILSGIDAGIRVAVSPPEALVDGALVEVRR